MTPSSNALLAARESTIDALCRHFAEDALTLAELERRLERARAASTRSELDDLLSDLRLHGPPPAVADATRTATTRPPRSKGQGTRSRAKRESFGIRPSKHLAFAVMGGTRRAGKWQPAESMLAISLMGGVQLDFRDAVFSTDVIDVTCLTFWGGVEIVVPPHVRVETNGIALLGGFDQLSDIDPAPRPGAPTIRVNGMAIMGGVEVKVREKGMPLKKDW